MTVTSSNLTKIGSDIECKIMTWKIIEITIHIRANSVNQLNEKRFESVSHAHHIVDIHSIQEIIIIFCQQIEFHFQMKM